MKQFIVICAALFGIISLAQAEEHFGIKVYPNVKTDDATRWYCSQFPGASETTAKDSANEPSKSSTFCFRTRDSFAKVVAFYQKQGGLEALGPIDDKGPNKGAVFCLPGMHCAVMDNGADVTVTTPWADSKMRHSDVLITIRESRKK